MSINNRKIDSRQQVMDDTRSYRTSVVLYRHMVARTLGVNITDMECLSLVYFNGLATPSELSEYTGLGTGATTAMIDRLEKSGLVSRKPNPRDRRSTLVTMTRAGTKKIESVFKPVRRAQKELLGRYTEQELTLLSDFLQRSAAMWTKQREKFPRR